MPDKYISLRKMNLDRGYRKSVQEVYEERLHSPSTIVFDFHVGDYPLFVVLTPRLFDLSLRIYQESATLADLQFHALPQIASEWYFKQILVDEIKLTNDMENVHSTRREVKEAIDSLSLPDRHGTVRFSGMASKYTNLLKRSVDVLKTCSDVRKLYNDFVAQEVISEDEQDAPDGQIFRQKGVYVQDTHGKIIHEGIYPESAIIEAMEKALGILNNESVNTLIRVAVFHYLFGYIHPFYNGNGRLSRYISSMMLSHDLSTLAGLRLSYVIKDHKRQYDNLFKEANDKRSKGDLTDFVSTFLEYISISLQDMIETLSHGKQWLYNLHRIVSRTPEFHKHENAIEILGMNGFFAEDYLSIDDLQKHAECGRASAQKALDIANGLGILTKVRAGHKYLYTIMPEAWSDLASRLKAITSSS